MKFVRRMAVAGGAVVMAGLCAPADAWGPTARTSMVTAAAHVLGQDPSFGLSRLARYVNDGASIPQADFDKMYPLYKVDPIGAIQKEMLLLESMRGDRIDPYYAYRLGALGRMVADATAPLLGSGPATRDKYYADVDNAIGRIGISPAARKVVDPRPYFNYVQAQASSEDQTIEIEYRTGTGFGGLARASLPEDASRSVNAVADVWYTVLTARPAVFDQPEASKRDFALGAVAFYLKQKNLTEAEESFKAVEAQGLMDANLRKAMGDLFFDNGLYDRSMVEYQKILESDANRRDVAVRVARFYEVTGDDAAKKENLEAARDAYAKALEADKLHPDAQRKLLNVEAKIFERDERMNSQKSSIDQARALENGAEEAAARRDFAQAISLLKEADARYAEVTDEFPLQSKDANTGRRMVQMRTKELKQQLIDNSASLSGTSTAFDVRQIAIQSPNVSEDALKQMLQSEYLGAVKALGNEMDRTQP